MLEPLAVIFDVDGVLVDSYQVHFVSWRDTLSAYGLEMDEPQFAETFGRTSREIIRLFFGDAERLDTRIQEIDDQKEARYREIVTADFPVMDGAHALVDALSAAGFVLAMGSSAPLENVELALDKLGRRDKFSAAVTGDDVTRGKPDPQVFLVAAERLDVAPENCAVIEDAASGIAAANAAGMTSIALVSTGRTREELRAADYVVDSLRELTPEAIRDLIVERYERN